jgi:hypothetical protein
VRSFLYSQLGLNFFGTRISAQMRSLNVGEIEIKTYEEAVCPNKDVYYYQEVLLHLFPYEYKLFPKL